MESLLRKLDMVFGLTGEVNQDGDLATVIYRTPSGVEICQISLAITECGWQIQSHYMSCALDQFLHNIEVGDREKLQRHPVNAGCYVDIEA